MAAAASLSLDDKSLSLEDKIKHLFDTDAEFSHQYYNNSIFRVFMKDMLINHELVYNEQFMYDFRDLLEWNLNDGRWPEMIEKWKQLTRLIDTDAEFRYQYDNNKSFREFVEDMLISHKLVYDKQFMHEFT